MNADKDMSADKYTSADKHVSEVSETYKVIIAFSLALYSYISALIKMPYYKIGYLYISNLGTAKEHRICDRLILHLREHRLDLLNEVLSNTEKFCEKLREAQRLLSNNVVNSNE